MPSPIDIDALWPLRDTVKEDFILTVDHRCEPNLTAQNVAAVTAIQRELGLRVVYCKPKGHTLAYAKLAGLGADFRTQVPFKEFVHLIARAKFGVDLYAAHANHRHAQAHAAIGTPLIGSIWTNPTSICNVGPFNIPHAVEEARALLNNPAHYEEAQRIGYDITQQLYSFKSARANVRRIMEAVGICMPS